MVDLLAHVLIGYGVCGLLAWSGRIRSRDVPLGMVGSVLPDAAKIQLLVPDATVESVLGVAFSWLALHSLGGVLALAGVGSLLVVRDERTTAFALLAGGGIGHLFLDALIVRAGGYAPAYLYPFSWWQPPAGGLYLSSDLAPLLVATAFAAATARLRATG